MTWCEEMESTLSMRVYLEGERRIGWVNRKRNRTSRRAGRRRTCRPWSVDQNPTFLKPPVHLPRLDAFSTYKKKRAVEGRWG